MKWLTCLLVAIPIWAFAQVDRNTTVEESTVYGVDAAGNKTVNQQRTIRQQEGNRDIYSSCKGYEWKTQISKNNAFRCNWSYSTALTQALTFALDGYKIDWYDEQSGNKGSIIVAHSMPFSDFGWCRLVITGDAVPGGTQYGSPFYMCYSQTEKNWYKWKGR
jgi:surface antigen